MIPVRPTGLDLQPVDRRADGFECGDRVGLRVENADRLGIAGPIAARAVELRRAAPDARRDATLPIASRSIMASQARLRSLPRRPCRRP